MGLTNQSKYAIFQSITNKKQTKPIVTWPFSFPALAPAICFPALETEWIYTLGFLTGMAHCVYQVTDFASKHYAFSPTGV